MAKIVVISGKALYLQSEGDRFESDMLHNLMANNKKGIQK